MIQFDRNGYLYPYEIIEVDWATFEIEFTQRLEIQAHRLSLLNQYQAYLHELKNAFKTNFFQWVDGSFISLKKRPGDIDVVTFLPYDLMVKKAIFVEQFRKTSKKRFGIDGFFAPTARWDHRFFESCKREEERWNTVFGSSREGHPKGIIKLNISL